MVAASGVVHAKSAPTFVDVAPILYKQCSGCHREGEAGPMSLLTYKQVRPWAKAIKEKLLSHEMPPGNIDPHYGNFQADRIFSEQELTTLVRWVDAGAPLGNAKAVPAVPKFENTREWKIGKPDLVLAVPAFEVPAKGVIDYQHFNVPTTLTEDRWVTAIEGISTARGVVHHAMVLMNEPGHPGPVPGVAAVPAPKDPPKVQPPPGQRPDEARVLGLEFGEQALLGFGAGARPLVYPPGTAVLIKAGTMLHVIMHYQANGTAQTDHSRIGLIFAKEKPTHEVHISGPSNYGIVIPPGEPNYKSVAEMLFTDNIHLLGLWPHMHLRGKISEFKAIFPDGREQILLLVPRFDQTWSQLYALKEPLDIPKGTRLRYTATYDNSKQNKNNPDATKEIRWGDQTWDEMMQGIVVYSHDAAPKRP